MRRRRLTDFRSLGKAHSTSAAEKSISPRQAAGILTRIKARGARAPSSVGHTPLLLFGRSGAAPFMGQGEPRNPNKRIRVQGKGKLKDSSPDSGGIVEATSPAASRESPGDGRRTNQKERCINIDVGNTSRTGGGGGRGGSDRSSARRLPGRLNRINFEKLTSAGSRDSLFVVRGKGNSELEVGRSPAARKANWATAVC
jgi:hypothetical protein